MTPCSRYKKIVVMLLNRENSWLYKVGVKIYEFNRVRLVVLLRHSIHVTNRSKVSIPTQCL